jgi:glycosyltransferase involved in cell wall biosynthesis
MTDSNTKKKLLFVVSEFYQAGTQRFTYEVDRALNKSKFQVEILCLLPLKANPYFTDYYYQKHLALGTYIHFLSEVDQRLYPTYWQRFKKFLFNSPLPDERAPLFSFFNRFDKIAVMGEYNYKEIARFLSAENRQKLIIHIQNSRFQKRDLYDGFDKKLPYHFVSGFYDDQLLFELEEFTSYQHTFFNLNLRFDPIPSKTEFAVKSIPRIGIFTRLTYTKPITPFLEVFARMVEVNPRCELHVFGAGDPEKEGVIIDVERLHLTPYVFFRGHQEKMTETALSEDIDIAFIHGYHGLPGGWVSFDLSRVGIPQVFWDFGHSNTGAFNEVFPMFQDAKQMADFCNELLNCPSKSELLAKNQLMTISDKHNIEKNIHVLEHIYATN